MRAVSDAGPSEPNSQKPEAIQNLFTLMDLVSTKETLQFFDDAFNNCTIRYGDMKKQLAEDMIVFVSPIRSRITEILKDESLLTDVMKRGKEKAQASARKTVSEVREIMGIRY